MRATNVAAMLLLGLLAGCLGGGDGPDGDTVLLGPASGLPTDPRSDGSLEAAPAWRLGEWWRIEFSAPLYGIEATVDRVVAGVHGGAYLVGFGEALDDGVLLLHFPGFGELARDSLAFEAHDRPMELVRFPLVEGATWTTQWYSGAPLDARVTRVAGGVATVELTGARTIELDYDAALGAISRLAIEGYGGYEVTDHGYGYEGTVLVPAGQDLVFCHGRQAVVQRIDLCEAGEPTDPAAPTDTLEMSDDYDRVSFGLFLRQAEAGPAEGGLLGIRVLTPWGEELTHGMLPTETGMTLEAHGHEDPGGTWEVTAFAGGGGLAILEGVAYDVLSVELVTP